MERTPCRTSLAHPEACGRRVDPRYLFCSACWRLVPRPQRVELERLRKTDRRGWVECFRRLVDLCAEARMKTRRPGEQRRQPAEFVDREEKRLPAGMAPCPSCLSHGKRLEFVLEEEGALYTTWSLLPKEERAAYQERCKAGPVESVPVLVPASLKPSHCTTCDGKGVVSIGRARDIAKKSEQENAHG